MKKNRRKNRWEATHPNDFIGWDILSHSYDDGAHCYIVAAINRGTQERRTVYATENAMPLMILEVLKGK